MSQKASELQILRNIEHEKCNFFAKTTSSSLHSFTAVFESNWKTSTKFKPLRFRNMRFLTVSCGKSGFLKLWPRNPNIYSGLIVEVSSKNLTSKFKFSRLISKLTSIQHEHDRIFEIPRHRRRRFISCGVLRSGIFGQASWESAKSSYQDLPEKN